MLAADRIFALMNEKGIFDNPELKGLKSFLEIPKKISYTEVGVTQSKLPFIRPSLNLYSNVIKLCAVIKDGPTHRLMKLLNETTRMKTMREKNHFTLGDLIFYNMMTEGFEFIDTANNITVSIDPDYQHNEFLALCVVEKNGVYEYLEFKLVDILIAMFKYHPDKFPEILKTGRPITEEECITASGLIHKFSD